MKKIFIANGIGTCDLEIQSKFINTYINTYSGSNLMIVDNPEIADIIIFTGTCCCNMVQIDNNIKYIKSILERKNNNAQTILTGCMTRKFKNINLTLLENILKWLQENIDMIVEDNFLPDLLRNILEKDIKFDIFSPLKSFTAPHSTYVQINVQNGCNNKCTFCKSSYQQFPVKSMDIYKFKNIIDYLISIGKRNLFICGSNLSQYGLDKYNEPLLPELIDYSQSKNEIDSISLIGLAFKDAIEYDFDYMIRDCSKVNLINGSLESGSPRILQLMQKGFSIEQFLTFMDRIREKHYVDFHTNIIAGFPTENIDDVKATIDVIKRSSPSYVAINGYIDSEFVNSHRLKQLSIETIKQRVKMYSDAFTEIGIDINNSDNNYIYNNKNYNYLKKL